MAVLTFLHISDTHISADPGYHPPWVPPSVPHPNRGVENLLAAVEQLPYEIDFILHTGDVCADPQAADYHQARRLLSAFEQPMYLLPGNHDSPQLMRDILDDGERRRVLRDECAVVNGVHLLALDTCGGGEAHAPMLAEAQIAWFADALEQAAGQPLLAALHHPLIPTGIDWIDRVMRVQNGERIQRLLQAHRGPFCGAFHGHIHQVAQSFCAGVLYSGGASTWYSLRAYPGLQRDAPDLTAPGGFNLVVIRENRSFVRACSLPLARG